MNDTIQLGLLVISTLPWIAYGYSATQAWNNSCPAFTNTTGKLTRTRYYDLDCVMGPSPHITKTGPIQDIHLAFFSSCTGAVGDFITPFEPIMRAALQEIEDLDYLPGFRLKLQLFDSFATAQDAVLQLGRALARPPAKYGIIGDSVSGGCMAMNDALQDSNLLQMSHLCNSPSLSDRARYPFFIRLAPSAAFQALVTVAVVQTFKWNRVSIVYENAALFSGVVSDILAKVSADTKSGTYKWTVLATLVYNSPADAPVIVSKLLGLDTHIIIQASYAPLLSLLVCLSKRSTLPPDWLWLVATATYPGNFLLQQQPQTGCSMQDMLRGGFNMLGFDRGPTLHLDVNHGLSGRRLADIEEQYLVECAAYAGGAGSCYVELAGYYYDTVWEFAWLLKQFLVTSNQTLESLRTVSSRQWIFNKALQADFQGSSGRVRHFSSSSPDKQPPSVGDRDGNMMVWQLTSMNSRHVTALWSKSSGLTWLEDVVWSFTDPSRRVSCNASQCETATGSVPQDRFPHCVAGSIYTIEAGCQVCPLGSTAALGDTSCAACEPGRSANVSGSPDCWPCPLGTASKKVAATECEPCSAGFIAMDLGQSQCTPCGLGTYSNSSGRSSVCTACPSGFVTASTGVTGQTDCICPKDSYRDGAACASCNFLMGTVGIGATSAGDCHLTTTAKVTAAGIVSSLALFSLLSCAMWRCMRGRYTKLEKEKRERDVLRITTAMMEADKLGHPMVLCSAKNFVEMGTLHSYEYARDAGKLVVLDTMAKVHDFALQNFIVFISHQWLGWGKPDFELMHYRSMKRAIDRLQHRVKTHIGEGPTPLERMYLWVDFSSISQEHRGMQMLAIASLPVYASVAHAFVIICPEARHQSTGLICNLTTYNMRGWCRAETISKVFGSGLANMFVVDNPEGELIPVTPELLNSSLSMMLFEADFSCCDRGHKSQPYCDKQDLVLPILGMYSKVRRKHGDPEYDYVIKHIEEFKERMFPKRFTFMKDDGQSEERELFGDLVEVMEAHVENQVSAVQEDAHVENKFSAVQDGPAMRDDCVAHIMSL
mmetsp:Transcript_48007/g.154887  ORF Transcript_48007/g.154887 Transcript_48007/m.154887 type:complete len:1050 (+) Transcript_48007:131-3280(+)